MATARYLLADPALTTRTPGEEFARLACAGAGSLGDVEMSLGVTLTTTFPLAEHRPRYTVRHLLKAATVVEEPVRYISEAAADGTGSGAQYTATPEARFRPSLSTAELADLVVDVPVPKGTTDDLALFAAYVDHRVVVRLCTVENEALLRGSRDAKIDGLLDLPGLHRRPAPGDLDDELAAAAAEVEEMGGSCDGIIAHPQIYWRLVRTGMLGRLAEAGVRVSRTRMIEANRLLLGDLRAAATLADTGSSTLAIRRGAGADGADLVSAHQRVGLAVNLAQHLLLLDLP